jgi:hypothetical protein
VRTGSLLAYRGIQAHLWQTDFGEKDRRKKVIGERDIGETIAMCLFN